MTVRELQDDREILAVLEADRAWGAYAITDLDQPYRQHARFLAPASDDEQAVVLVYTPPEFATIVPHGNHGGVRIVLESAENLPPACLVLARESDLPSIETRYQADSLWTMERMAVNAADLNLIEDNAWDVRQLSEADFSALQSLYAHGAESIFGIVMLRHGIYMGAFDGDRLVGAAGTHTLSAAFGVATIGGVFTHPEYRGKGLASVTTSAVARAAVQRGIGFLALNVKSDNEPAIRVYSRMGFTARVRYWEGTVVAR